MPQCCPTFLEFSMSQPERGQVEQAIQTYIDPYLHKNLLELKAVQNIRIEGSRVEVDIRLGYPADSLKGAIRQILTHAIEDIDGVEQVEIKVDWEVVPHRSEERRVGKECRCRWWRYHSGKKRESY